MLAKIFVLIQIAGCLFVAGCASTTNLTLKTEAVALVKAPGPASHRLLLIAQKQRGEPQIVDEFRRALAATNIFTIVDVILDEQEPKEAVFARARKEQIDYIVRIDVKQYASATTGADRKLAATYFKAWGITYGIGSAILARTKWLGLAGVKANVNVWSRSTSATSWEYQHEHAIVEEGKESVNADTIKQSLISLATTNLVRQMVNKWVEDARLDGGGDEGKRTS